MKKIDWNRPFLGGDGVVRSRKEVEHYFLGLFEKGIRKNLDDLRRRYLSDPAIPGEFIDDLDFLIKRLRFILLATPEFLEMLSVLIWVRMTGYYLNPQMTKKTIRDFAAEVYEAFNYDGFRKAKLNRIAVVMNVKTCLYCNQQYTIAIGKNPNRNGDIKLDGSDAFMQFDHFFGKAEYPILSMSLYNLIPSCPFCNQKKSAKHVSLRLHPYVDDLSSMLRFHIKNQDAFINPKFKDLDMLEVEINTSDDEVREFVESLDLKRRYARHLDIVQDLEVALYMAPYYNGNFKDIEQIFEKDSGHGSERLRILQRHFKGFYTDPDDINKRPLTKFSQDIYAQLCSWQEGF